MAHGSASSRHETRHVVDESVFDEEVERAHERRTSGENVRNRPHVDTFALFLRAAESSRGTTRQALGTSGPTRGTRRRTRRGSSQTHERSRSQRGRTGRTPGTTRERLGRTRRPHERTRSQSSTLRRTQGFAASRSHQAVEQRERTRADVHVAMRTRVPTTRFMRGTRPSLVIASGSEGPPSSS